MSIVSLPSGPEEEEKKKKIEMVFSSEVGDIQLRVSVDFRVKNS